MFIELSPLSPRLKYVVIALVMAVLGIAAGLFASTFLGVSTTLGKNIPAFHIASDYVAGVITASCLFIVIFFLPIEMSTKKALAALWVARSMVTLGFMLYYEYIYRLDAYNYYTWMQAGYKELDWFLFDGTNTVISIGNMLIKNFPFLNFYHALKVLFSFLGLIGALLFFRGYQEITGDKDPMTLYLIGLFPSSIFWSSILGKDPIVFFLLSCFFYGTMLVCKKISIKALALLIVGAIGLVFMRFWLAPVATVSLLVAYNLAKSAKISTIKIAVGVLVVFGSVAFFSIAAEQFKILSFNDLIERIQTMSRSWGSGGSTTSVPVFTGLKDLVLYLPIGAFTAIFRPLPGDVMNLFGVVAGLENLVLLVMYGIALFSYKIEERRTPFMLYITTFIAIWGSLYAFISPQNLGTASRFKLQILPLMLIYIQFVKFKKQQKTMQNENNPT
ncbi:MAG: hypothetical protein R2827_11125 [Bdellovibrionales bacterium]